MLIQRIALSSDLDNALSILNESIAFYKPIMESLMKKEIRSSDYHAVAGTVILSATLMIVKLKHTPHSVELVNETQSKLEEIYQWLKTYLIHEPDNVKAVFTEYHRVYAYFNKIRNEDDKFFEESVKYLSFVAVDFEHDLVID